MRTDAQRYYVLLVLCSALFIVSCGVPIPKDKLTYVGTWKGDSISLVIDRSGKVDYKLTQGTDTKHIRAPIQKFDEYSLTIGLLFIKTTLKVQQPPEEMDGIWTMVVEDEELIKYDSQTEKRLALLGQSAIRAAQSFLSLMDSGDYIGAWELSEPMLQIAYSREKWHSILSDARVAFGPVSSRNLTAVRYTRRLNNAPKGQFIVLAYTTHFTSNQHAVEKVTMLLDRNGRWLNGGYWISQYNNKAVFSPPSGAEESGNTIAISAHPQDSMPHTQINRRSTSTQLSDKQPEGF